MGAEHIQGNYDELDRIAATFDSTAAAVTDMVQQVSRQTQALAEGGWLGLGANRFVQEMQDLVIPGLNRLASALEEARATTQKIGQIFHEAEDEAGKIFSGMDMPAPGPSGKSGELDDAAMVYHGTLTKLNVPVTRSIADNHFNSKRNAYTVSKPTTVTDHPYRSGKTTALKYQVEVGGQKIDVYVPQTPDAKNGNFHTIDQIAKGLAALPEANRKLITRVNVEPGMNPDDAFWQKKYNNPNHRSYMTASPTGVVSIYPSEHPQRQTSLDGNLIHESGHTFSSQKWGSNSTAAAWKPWRDAMAADGNAVSGYSYGSGSASEDFSEAMVVYQAYKGTPQEKAMRAKYGHRFDVLDGLLK